MATEVIMPKLGLTMSEGSVVRWMKQDGEAVKKGEPMFEVQTDKVVLEVEAPADGTLKVLIKENITVPVTTVIAWVLAPGESVPGEAKAPEAPTAQAQPAAAAPVAAPAVEAEKPGPTVGGRIVASPAAKRVAKELGVDLSLVKGTGPEGRVQERDVRTAAEAMRVRVSPVARQMADEAGLSLSAVKGTGTDGMIMKEDVERALGKAPAPVPTPAPAPVAPAPRPYVPAEAETVPVAGIRQIIFDRMGQSSRTTASVTEFVEVDATNLVEMRTRMKSELQKSQNLSIGYNEILAKIVGRALTEHRLLNAALVDNQIKLLPQVNVGIAVDTDRGLLVPVVRDVDKKGLTEIVRDFRALVERAQAGKSLPDDLTGGTFTITNLGMFEIDGFTPIINLPEAAILGVGRIVAKPVVHGGEIVIRQMMVLSLTFDHRLVDGAPAARFLQRVKNMIENPYLMLM